MRKVAGIFSGTELESFSSGAGAGPRLALEVDLYAHQRFPHDLRFVRRSSQPVHDALAAMRRWSSFCGSTGPNRRICAIGYSNCSSRIRQARCRDSQQLRQQAPEIDKADWTGLATRNPAAERFWMEACLWQSHFEQGVGAADALAAGLSRGAALGEQASSLYPFARVLSS